MYGTCRTVSWNVIILNNINDNTVISTHYTLKETSNAPFIILSISSMLIICAILNLQYIKFKAFSKFLKT